MTSVACVLAIIAATALTLPAVSPTPAYPGGANIFCTLDKKTYETLGECHCAAPPGTSGLAALNARCAVEIDPQCPLLVPLKALYEDAGGPEFRRLGVGGTPAGTALPQEENQRRLVRAIIRQLPASPAHGVDAEGWKRLIYSLQIKFVRNVDYGGQYSSPPPLLEVNSSLVSDNTLSATATVIGHEMIHATQHFRPITGQRSKIGYDAMADPFTDPFIEFEAWAWSANLSGYTWDLPPNPATKCVKASSQKSLEMGAACQEWRISAGLHALLKGPDRLYLLMEKFLEANWWTSAYWLRKHHAWPTEYGDTFRVPGSPVPGCTAPS